MNHHTQLLQYLIDKHNLKSYLEIGCQNKANNFNKIQVKEKWCVDPDPKAKADFVMTSDEYFYKQAPTKNVLEEIITPVDLAFIDGHHEEKQVKRDFEGALKALNEGGFIVLHDTLPENEQGTKVPRETKIWWGNVYRFAMNLGYYDDIEFVTVNMDCGCTVVWKTTKREHSFEWVDNITYSMYEQNKHWLNIIQPSEIEKYLG